MLHTGLRTIALAVVLSAAAAGADRNDRRDFSRLVAVGDSLSAGFQSFSSYEAGQLNSYAAFVARQAGLTVNGSQMAANTFAVPLISYPGIPPALTFNPATGQILQNPMPGMPIPGGQPSNLSVPGFTLLDALAHPFPGSPATNPIDALADITFTRSTTFGCGPIPVSVLPFLPLISPTFGQTQYVVSPVACAAALRPTAVLVSIGNNDALQSLTFGLPPTDTNVFAARYAAVLGALSATGADVIVSNIPDVSAVPFLVPVRVFKSPRLCSFVPPGATADDFVVLNLTNPAGGTNLCTNYAIRTKSLIDATGVAVAAFNRIIAAQARLFRATVVDMNGLFARLAVTGYKITVNNRVVHFSTAMFGGLFSLDGIHPTNTGYAILANEAIAAINAAFPASRAIPLVNVNQVAAADPLAFPLFKH